MRIPKLVSMMKHHLCGGQNVKCYNTFVLTRYPVELPGANVLYYMPPDRHYVIGATDLEWSVVEGLIGREDLLIVEVPETRYRWETQDKAALSAAIRGPGAPKPKRSRPGVGGRPRKGVGSIFKDYPHQEIDYMYKDGMMIKDIANSLGLPLPQLYRYFNGGFYQKVLDNEFALAYK